MPYVTNYVNAKSRYKNYYTSSYIAKSGDAILETNGWHSDSSSVWLNYNGDKGYDSGLIRAYLNFGSIFSYYGRSPR